MRIKYGNLHTNIYLYLFINVLKKEVWRPIVGDLCLWQPFRSWRGEKMYAVVWRFFVRDIKVRILCKCFADLLQIRLSCPLLVSRRGGKWSASEKKCWGRKKSHKRLNARVFPMLSLLLALLFACISGTSVILLGKVVLSEKYVSLEHWRISSIRVSWIWKFILDFFFSRNLSLNIWIIISCK